LQDLAKKEEEKYKELSSIPENKTSDKKTEISPIPACKICLGDEINDLNNPLITPCQCAGSMKFIHLNCLRQWIRQRITVSSSNSVTAITWKILSCELCKNPYPFAVYFNDKIHELITTDVPKPPYMVLESIVRNSEEANGIYILNFFPKTSISVVFLIIFLKI